MKTEKFQLFQNKKTKINTIIARDRQQNKIHRKNTKRYYKI